MARYGPTRQQLAELSRSTGCDVISEHALPDGEIAYRLECHSDRNKVKLLAGLAGLDAREPATRRAAELLSATVGGDRRRTVELLHRLVCQSVRFVREPTETFSPTRHTLAIGLGDCDDSARALGALLRAIGYRVRFATLGSPRPSHVAAQVWHDGQWHWLETTLPGARAGEHPVAAARRLKATGRDDIT